jgi:hypothetical protein
MAPRPATIIPLPSADPRITSAEAEATHTSKPKILRRPPQFSEPSTEAGRLTPHAPAPDAAIDAATMPLSRWQEDARFAVVLLVVISVLNLILYGWLADAGKAPESSVELLPSGINLLDGSAEEARGQ